MDFTVQQPENVWTGMNKLTANWWYWKLYHQFEIEMVIVLTTVEPLKTV